MDLWTPAELTEWLADPEPASQVSVAVAVDVRSGWPTSPVGATVRDAYAAVPTVVIGVGDESAPLYPELVDVVVTPDQLPAVLEAVRAQPRAAATLALLLRGAGERGIGAGLVAESTAYSLLQGGPDFAAWRSAHPPRIRTGEQSAVRVERVGDELRVTLDRPEVRNALNARMRDELVEALTIAVLDPLVTVTLAGAGPAFCAGGDLDEFGTRPDPVTAHLTRLGRSPAALLARLSDRVTARLHGACYGSGIELPAFAGRVVAAPDTRVALPEVALGLIPGAGGTVSLPRRIGRHRTAWLALTGLAIDATTAHSWGLVDAVDAQAGRSEATR